MEIYLVRHTSVAVTKGTCYGQLDVELADSFIEEAEKVKRHLPKEFDAVFSSPSKRCVKLVEELNFIDYQTDSRLLEMNFGDWEGTKWEEINQAELNSWMEDFVTVKPKNGECLLDIYHRVSDFLNQLRSGNLDKVLIVTHGGIIRCVKAYILHIPLSQIFEIPVDFGEIVHFRLA